MASTEVDNGYEFSCDVCHDAVIEPPKMGSVSEKPDFMFCWGRAKEQGWRARSAMSRDGRTKYWRHICPSC